MLATVFTLCVPASLAVAIPASELPVAPAPREQTPPVRMTSIRGGYQVILNRATAELLQEALDPVDPKQLAATLQKVLKQRWQADPDDQLAATLELVTLAVSTQLPGFKNELAKKLGPGGVVITVTGLQKAQVTFRHPRPRLEAARDLVRTVQPLLPHEAREAIEAVRALARTTPLIWKVEPNP
jgi:hypothetical protein